MDYWKKVSVLSCFFFFFNLSVSLNRVGIKMLFFFKGSLTRTPT